jgi:predicted transcriptional regulator
MPDREQLLTLASEIVSAHISNNAVAYDQLPALIQQVFNTLSAVGQASIAPTRPEPVIPIKQSVKADHLVCLECGRHVSMLKRHLATDRELTPEQYRQRWSLPGSYPPRGAELRQDSVCAGEEDRVGSKGRNSAEGGWSDVGKRITSAHRCHRRYPQELRSNLCWRTFSAVSMADCRRQPAFGSAIGPHLAGPIYKPQGTLLPAAPPFRYQQKPPYD